MKLFKLIRIIYYYFLKDKTYPIHLYNMYGSEGHSPDRQYVNNLIKVHGFWVAVKIIINN